MRFRRSSGSGLRRAGLGILWGTLVFSAVGREPAAADDAPGFTWEPAGLGGGGAMFTPAISPLDPDRMMLNCDMSGAYLSRDGGRSWSLIHHRQLRGNIRCRPAFHPREPDTLFAAHGWPGELRVSRDGGRHFAPIGDLPPGLTGEIAIDPDEPNRMLVGVNEGVALSTNGGAHWTICSALSGPPLAFHFGRGPRPEARALYAGTRSGLFRSDDGGRSWQIKNRGLPTGERLSFAGGSDPRTGATILYVSTPGRAQNGQYGGGIFRSLDRGESWTSVMTGAINRGIRQVDRWADGPVAQYPCLLAGDGDPRTVYAFNTSTGFHPPHHNAVWKSEDAGESWRATFYSDPRWTGRYNVEPNWRTATLGRNFQEAGLGWALGRADSRRVLFTDSGFAYFTRDGGETWGGAMAEPADPTVSGPESRWRARGLVVTTTWHYYVDPHAPARHFIAYTDIGFARSTDAGQSWQWWPERGRPPWQNTCYELAFDPAVSGRIWGAFSDIHDIPNGNIIENRHRSSGPGGVCLSEDGGQTWAPQRTGLPLSAVTSVVVDPRSPPARRRLLAAVWEHGVYESREGGAAWRLLGRGLGSERNRRVSRVILHPDGTLWALVTALRVGRDFQADGVGLYRFDPAVDAWECLTPGRFLWPKDFMADPADSRVIDLGVADAGPRHEGGLYRTEDGGRTWRLLARKGPEHFGAYRDPRRPGWIYMTLTEGAPESGLYLSRDRGATFDPVDSMPFANIQRVAFDPRDARRIYVTTFGAGVWRGTLDGRNPESHEGGGASGAGKTGSGHSGRRGFRWRANSHSKIFFFCA